MEMEMEMEMEIDRLSSLPDDLLHEILSHLELYSRQAVETSLLSRRWRRVWATLPHLEFYKTKFYFSKFVSNFLSKRDHNAGISKLICCFQNDVGTKLINKVANYAISHNVQEFSLHSLRNLTENFPLRRLFSSPSLKKLELNTELPELDSKWKNLRSSLTSLSLGACKLPEYPWSFPVLTTLHLIGCELPLMSWSLPALTTLHLTAVTFLGERDFSFDNFPHLKNLYLCALEMWYDVEVFNIALPNLTHLTISEYYWGDPLTCKFLLSAPRLSYFGYNGDSPITCKFLVSAPRLSYFGCKGNSPILLSAKDGFPCLEKVDIDIPHIIESCIGMWNTYLEEKKQVFMSQLISMFQEVRGAKFLTLSINTIKLLSSFTNLLEQPPSPFGNLKRLKLQEKGKSANSTMLDHVRIYFISSSPSATIVIEGANGIRNYNAEVKSDTIMDERILMRG